jgi:hypothetical protein
VIGFISTSLQLQSSIRAHSQWMTKTRSIPYWTTSLCSSSVTDLVLIYESVTSSAATALDDGCLMNESLFSARLLIQSVGNHGKCLLPVCCHGNAPCTELVCRNLPSKQRVLSPHLFVTVGTCLATCYPATEVPPLLNCVYRTVI